MPHSNVACLDLPNGFDAASYDQVNDKAAKLANPNDAAAPWKRNCWFGYASAWNGVAARLRAAVAYDTEFSSLMAHGTAPAPEERDKQERALFGCIVSALSAVECFYMACYCLAASVAPSVVRLASGLASARDLNQSPVEVAFAIRAWQPGASFAASLVATASSTDLKSLADLRNTLAHRGVLPRQHYLGNSNNIPSAVPANPKELAEDFAYSAPLGTATTSTHSAWAVNTCSGLTVELNAFLAPYVLRDV